MTERDMTDCARATDSITVLMRSYFSTHHLYAARYAAESAQSLETSLAGQSVFDLRHRTLVISAICESAFFLEAAINEIFQDAKDEHHSYIGGLDGSLLSAMAAVWDATNNGYLEVLKKYDLALRLAGHESFDPGTKILTNARLLVQLRNYLVHYRPEFVGNDLTHRLGKSLEASNRFAENELMKGSGNPWFPDRALGAGCADWAWRSARALTDEFARRMQLTLNYQAADYGDPLPQ
ncbi:hypothetical protein ABZU32_10905 [Sphaerisporangium sp. NPDC005288]|uniref:hypothetical protein n=1 Tax=Sphaerisporangium sp. NPDC005288 TaxID=3155114 RepID=UPI0033A1190D